MPAAVRRTLPRPGRPRAAPQRGWSESGCASGYAVTQPRQRPLARLASVVELAERHARLHLRTDRHPEHVRVRIAALEQATNRRLGVLERRLRALAEKPESARVECRTPSAKLFSRGTLC